MIGYRSQRFPWQASEFLPPGICSKDDDSGQGGGSDPVEASLDQASQGIFGQVSEANAPGGFSSDAQPSSQVPQQQAQSANAATQAPGYAAKSFQQALVDRVTETAKAAGKDLTGTGLQVVGGALAGPVGQVIGKIAGNVAAGRDAMDGVSPTGTSPGLLGNLASFGLAGIGDIVADAARDAGLSVSVDGNQVGGAGDAGQGPGNFGGSLQQKLQASLSGGPAAGSQQQAGGNSGQIFWNPSTNQWQTGGGQAATGAGGTGNVSGTGSPVQDPLGFNPVARTGNAEKDVLNAQLDAMDRILYQMAQNSGFVTKQMEELLGIQASQKVVEQMAKTEAQGLTGQRDQLFQQAMQNLSSGFQATPQDLEMIGGVAQNVLNEGFSNIDDMQLQAMQAVRDITAPARGLRPVGTPGNNADSPIISAQADIATQGIREKGDLTSRVRAAQLQEVLNFPVTRGTAVAQSIAQTANLVEGARQFQQTLAQNALVNRLQGMNTVGSLSIGSFSGQQPNLSGSLSLEAAKIGAASNQSINAANIKAAEPSLFDRLTQGVSAAAGGAFGLGTLVKAFG